MRRPVSISVLALVALVIALPAAPGLARPDARETTSRALIEYDYDNNVIDRAQVALLKAYSVYAPWKLPDEYRGGVVGKCGLPVIKEIEEELPTLPGDVAEEIRRLRDRPPNQTYIDTDHFRIHYDTTGGAKIYGWPDTTYRDAVMAAAERSWLGEVDTLGFREPSPDGDDPDGGGGSPLYDIYVQECYTNYYGYIQTLWTDPGTPQNDVSSYIVIDNDYEGFGYPDRTEPMKVTVAHEFNHACQMAHDYGEGTWYMECSATWVEDEMYDDINDYVGYIPYFLTYPYWSLDANDGTGLRIYGSCIWNKLLTQHVDPLIVPAIWYRLENSGDTFFWMDLELGDYGTSLEVEFQTFAVWNWFCGPARDDGNHHEEGGTWGAAAMTASYNSYPVVDGTPTASKRPDRLACNYIRFINGGGGWTGLEISYDGPSPSSWPNYAFVNYDPVSGSTGEHGEIMLTPLGRGSTTVEDWDLMENVCLVAANLGGSDDMDYTYDADEYMTSVPGENHTSALKQASPNPFAESTSIAYTVPVGGGLVEITVYDVTGREVRSLVRDRMPAGDGRAVWDGIDNNGRRVASGIYFARLDIDGLTASGKLVVLK